MISPELIMSNFAMHVSLDMREATCVQSILQQRKVKKNAYVLCSGEKCRYIYFVDEGCLRIYHTDHLGNEHNISFCPENWWAVDMSSFSRQIPAFYSISALEHSTLFYLSYPELEKLYEQVPKLERFFRILTQNGFDLYQQRITSSLSKMAEERYAQFQKQYTGLEQRIAQKHIASYLGITPVFLSRLRRRI